MIYGNVLWYVKIDKSIISSNNTKQKYYFKGII